MTKLLRPASLLVISAALACSTPRADAQTPVHWTATLQRAPARGGSAAVKLVAVIDKGWHIYATNQGPGGPVPTRITVPSGQPFVAGGPVTVAPPPHSAFDEAFRITVLLHEKRAEFVVPVKSVGTTAADSIHVNARYQVCNATLCLPPQTARLSVPARATGAR